MTPLIFSMLLGSACKSDSENPSNQLDSIVLGAPTSQFIDREDFQALLDSTKLEGSILIYNPQIDTYYSNDFRRAETGFIPASTFKIPNSLIGLETGVITDTTVFKWDGEPKWIRSWEKDHDIKSAYKVSCVWCYQDLARRIGSETMRASLDQIAYPGMVFDSTSIDSFWLEGDSRISQMSQVAFLQGINQEELNLKESTYKALREIMLFEEKARYSIRAKTGMSGGNDGGVGWFVGFVERGDSVAYFATNLAYEGEADMSTFPKRRIDLSRRALERLGWLN